MTLNVLNHNGALLADNFLDPQSIPQKTVLIDIWFEGACFNNSLTGSGWLRTYQQAYVINVLD